MRRHGEQSRVTYWCEGCQELRSPAVPAWAHADAPTPVDLQRARERRREPFPSGDDTGDITGDITGDVSGPIDDRDVAPALERHPAAAHLLGGFAPRGPAPSYVDPLLGRGQP